MQDTNVSYGRYQSYIQTYSIQRINVYIKTLEDKKNIEELLNRINSELDNIDYTFISERIHNEESIKKITQKIMETKQIIERIEKNCIVFNNYSEDN